MAKNKSEVKIENQPEVRVNPTIGSTLFRVGKFTRDDLRGRLSENSPQVNEFLQYARALVPCTEADLKGEGADCIFLPWGEDEATQKFIGQLKNAARKAELDLRWRRHKDGVTLVVSRKPAEQDADDSGDDDETPEVSAQ